MKNIKLIILCVLFSSAGVFARVHELITDHPQLAQQNFNGLLTVNRFAIVLFNPYRPEFEIDQVEDLLDIFKTVSREGRYKSGDLTFITINLYKHPEFGKRFGLKPISIQPPKGEMGFNVQEPVQTTVVLYKDGVAIKQDDSTVQLKGAFTKSELKDFIEKNLKKQIDKTIERKKERMVVETSYVQDYYPDYYNPSYQPYFHYSPYYYRPYWGSGFGFGVGFGRGWGYGGWW